MLMPKRVKYRRVHRGRMTGVASRGNKVSYGEQPDRGRPCGHDPLHQAWR